MLEMFKLAASFGVGAIVLAFIQKWIDRKNNIDVHLFEIKRARYSCVVMLMLCKLNPDKHLSKVRRRNDDIQSIDDLNAELCTERDNSLFYASDSVVIALSRFILSGKHKDFVRTVIAMRKDLFLQKTKLDESALTDLLNIG